MSSKPALHGERRQLTVMFADLVGSAELSSQLDPEDWHDIVNRFHEAAAAVIDRYDGYVAQYLGDGILILFGYPKAHENDAERAVLAGLSILEELGRLNSALATQYDKRLAIRIGVDTGEVMVRKGSKDKDSGNIFGEAPNIAARVQSLADPNAICISASTQRLVAGFFVVEDLGPHVLKGRSAPIALYRVQRATGVRSRLHAAALAAMAPFVGREDERNLLIRRWASVQNGLGQLVVIQGEAGIGKSRLLRQFKQDLGEAPHTWVEGESSPYEQDTPFAPTVDMIENAFQWTPDTPAEDKVRDLESSLALVGMDPNRSVPLMAHLLGFQIHADRYPPLLLSPEQRRVELIQTLVDWALGTARLQPTVLVIEDLHFADPSTVEELILLSEQLEEVPLLLILTARTSFESPWPTRPFHSLLRLEPLAEADTRSMMAQLLDRKIDSATLDSLVARTDGVPLFAEELCLAVAASPEATVIEQRIPATLQELLMARLDSLGTSKQVAQIGAVVGRKFSYPIVRAIADMPEAELRGALSQLIDARLVYPESSVPDPEYTFRHALVQQAAYNALLKSRRRELHLAVARALESGSPELVERRPELLAHHLTEAGEAEQAIEAWQAAGEYAAGRAAIIEAQRYYSMALGLLPSLPEEADRAQTELSVQLALGQIREATRGIGSPEAVQAFTRARELAGVLDESPQFFFILLGLWSSAASRSELQKANEISRQLQRIAERDQEPMLLVWAMMTRAIDAFGYGEFADVSEYVERARSHYDPEDHTWSPFDPLVTVGVHDCLAHWHLGLIDQARQKLAAQLELGQSLSPANTAMARLASCNLYLYLQDSEAMLANAEHILRIAEEQQLPSFLAWGAMYRGIGQILQGLNEEGIATLTDGIAAYLASGTHSSLGLYLSRIAIGYAQLGDAGRALETINDAFGAAPQEKMHLPEFHRLRGDFLWLNEELQLAEHDYRKSIDVSRDFNAFMQELRAATRLGRLLQNVGRGEEVEGVLVGPYRRIREGHGTPDLLEAKAVLDELQIEVAARSLSEEG